MKILLCPNCRSPDIQHQGAFELSDYECLSCESVFCISRTVTVTADVIAKVELATYRRLNAKYEGKTNPPAAGEGEL